METPSSTTRRITRSQTKQTNLSRKMEESKQKSVKQDRSVLLDITNDSPIVGLASGNLATPISSVAKQSRNRCKRTPGSGEALLRCQVKTLLQKVEEEAEISKFDIGSGNDVKGFDGIVAPTPANTPQVLDFSSDFDDFCSFTCVSQSPIQDLLTLSQVMKGNHDVKKEASEVGLEAEKDVLISRSLFLDFLEKSDSSSECSSVLTYQGTVASIETDSHEKSVTTTMEDDDASLWSIQVNASTEDEDEDGVYTEVIDDDDDVVVGDNDSIYTDSDLIDLDELCDEMGKISVNGERQGAKFMGRHIRFVYDSDEELVEESEEHGFEDDSTEILRLKGLPTPKGKHLRFRDDVN